MLGRGKNVLTKVGLISEVTSVLRDSQEKDRGRERWNRVEEERNEEEKREEKKEEEKGEEKGSKIAIL